MERASPNSPVILFGAFDRHNFGDLLFPHIVSALLPHRSLLFAGVAQRDLRMHGGHQVHALSTLLTSWAGEPPAVLHAGGEILDCDTWEAAVMLLSSQEAHAAILAWDDKPDQRLQWAKKAVGVNAQMPYMVERALLPPGSRIVYNAVGGVHLMARSPEMYAEVLDNLATADAVGVRDKTTFAQLAAAGVQTHLMPDPAVLTAELFEPHIRMHAEQGDAAVLRRTFPAGYIAVQFSADFGDDVTLGTMVTQLEQLVAQTGYGIVLFRAGAAPWHDDLEVYQRLAAQLPAAHIRISESLDIWDICAVIADSQGYCGSSLHGRIVAMAFGLPRINIIPTLPAGQCGKQAAYAATWEEFGMPTVALVSQIVPSVLSALSTDARRRQQRAKELALTYRKRFAALCDDAAI